MHYETIAKNILRQHQTEITIIIKGFQPNYPLWRQDKYEIGVKYEKHILFTTLNF